MSPIIVAHVAAGGVSLVTGYIALFATKGAPLHRRVGLAFVVAMVAMAIFALLYMTVEGAVIRVNVLASTISAYLVVTSLITVREPSQHQRAIDAGSAVMALAIGVAGLSLGYVAQTSARGRLDGIPAFPYFMFGTIGMLAAIGDLRMIRAGGVAAITGTKRVTRHLWRMTFALFIAAMSFFLGQSDEFPKWLRVWPVMAGPPLVVLVSLLYWMWRVRWRRSMRGLVLPRLAVSPGPETSAPIA